MNKTIISPPEDVLKTFNLSGRVKRLNGGQESNFLVKDVVLKKVENAEELLWIAKTLENITNKKLRLQKYLKSKNNKYIEKGWSAYKFLEGKHYNKNWKRKKEVSELFHNIFKDIKKPGFINNRINPWSLADKMTWGEIPIKIHPKIRPYADNLVKHISPIKLKSQVIHGDIQGNILFSKGKSPAVIDLSLYWRPADFALAVMVVDALVWEDASRNILKLFKGKKEFTQLLLRAELRRILEIGLCVKYLGYENIEDIYKHKETIDFLCSLPDKKYFKEKTSG